MTRHRKIACSAAAVLALAGAVIYARFNDHGRSQLLKVRRELIAQGFKTNFADLDLSRPADYTVRASALLAAAEAARDLFPTRELMPMRPFDEQSARVVSRQPSLSQDSNRDGWPIARTNLAGVASNLDAACAALASGPFRFERTSWGLTPQLRFLCSALAGRMALALHDQDRAAAWSNLLASVRLASAWDVEPNEGACVIRFFIITTAERATWEALQWPIWTDSELAQLQREWESIDCFRALPETAAVTIAATAQLFDYERHLPPPPPVSLGQLWNDLLTSPSAAWREFAAPRANPAQFASWRKEAAYLTFYRERYDQLKKLNRRTPWIQIRAWPGMTNRSPISVNGYSLFPDVVNPTPNGSGFPFRAEQGGTVTRAALAETRRCLSTTAIAIERFRLARNSLPPSLRELAPAFLSAAPSDFMNGDPLHYRLVNSTNFLLYSVGLDCKDDGGRIAPPDAQQTGFRRGNSFFRQDGPDVVWPMPAP